MTDLDDASSLLELIGLIRGGIVEGSLGAGAGGSVSAGTPAWASNWFAALANRALAPAVVAVTGSSTVQGYVATSTTRRAVTRMAQQLQARYAPGQAGFHARALDSGYAYTGGVTSATTLAGACGRQVLTLPNAATVTRTDTCTGFRVFYGQGPGAGSFTISIDGSVVATITPDTTGAARADGVWSSATLTRASHVLLITATSAGALIEGVYVFDGDNTTGVWTFCDGHAGASVADFTSTGPARLAQQGVGLYVLIPGATEYGANGTAAQFQTDLTALIAQRRAASSLPASYLIVGTFPRPDKGPTNWQPFLAAMKAVADASPADVGFVDLSAPFPTVASGTGDPFNLINDGDIHLTDRGHQMLGDLLAGAVIEAGVRVSGALAGSSSAGSGAADTTAPTVTSFTATPGNTQNVLNWTDADNVAVTRRVLKTGSTTLYDGTALTYTHTGLTNGTPMSYSLVVYDAAGNPSTTATASATPTTGAYDPTQISGLSYWMDPAAIGAAGGTNGSAVASWPDKSSNAATATQGTSGARPTYQTAGINSLPAVLFATAQQLVSAATASDAAFTLIATVAPTGTGNRTVVGSSASGGHQVRVAGGTAGTFFASLVNQGVGVRAQQTTGITAASAVLTVTWDGTNTVIRMNGTVVAASATAQVAPVASLTTTIGAKDTATGDAYTGYLGDIVKVGRVLTNAELLAEERRQGAKYGITVA